MRVLVACEESQTVMKAFLALGHDAWSCDLQECSGGMPERHLQCDVFDIAIPGQWDMMCAFPPCTYLTVTANKWMKDQPERKSGALVGEARRKAREEAITFFLKLADLPIDKIAIENPIGCMSTRWRKPDQVIQPFWFGHKERKSTCLWLKGLNPLVATDMVEPISYIAAGKKYSPTHYNSKRSLNRLDSLPPGPERSKLRSTTYPGIAKAMATQWGTDWQPTFKLGEHK